MAKYVLQKYIGKDENGNPKSEELDLYGYVKYNKNQGLSNKEKDQVRKNLGIENFIEIGKKDQKTPSENLVIGGLFLSDIDDSIYINISNDKEGKLVLDLSDNIEVKNINGNILLNSKNEIPILNDSNGNVILDI